MQGSSYTLNNTIGHEFNKTSRLLSFSMLFALAISSAANIYPMIYFSEVEIIPSKLKNPLSVQPLQIVLVQASSVKIKMPTVSDTTSTLIQQSRVSQTDTSTPENKFVNKLLIVDHSTRSGNKEAFDDQTTQIELPTGNRKTSTYKPKEKMDSGNKTTNAVTKQKVVTTKKPRTILKNKPNPLKAIKKKIERTKSAQSIVQSVQPLYKLTVMPAFAHKEKPKYPEIERKLGTESVVIAAATIDKKGAVKQVQIVQTGGSNFDKAVISALYKSNFYPALIDNLAVATKLQIPYEFELE